MSKQNFTKPKIFDHDGDMSLSWFVYFRHTNPETGVRKQFRYKKGINYFFTREERRREAGALAKELYELLKGGWNPWKNEVEHPQKTLLQLCEEMWKLKKSGLEEESKRTYLYKYRHWTSWLEKTGYENFSPTEFGVKHAFEYLDHCTKCGYDGAYFNSYREMAYSLMNMLTEREHIKTNPFSKTKGKKKAEGSSVTFTQAQVRLVRNYLSRKYPDTLAVFCDYIYYTFMRPLELTQLQIKHFDFDRYRIKLPPEISKNDRSRVIIMPPALRKHARELRKNLPKIYARYNREYPNTRLEDYYIFGIYKRGFGPQPSPRPYKRRDSLTTMFREKVRKPLRLPKELTPYVFKHTGVDSALDSGLSITSTMKQTGHKSLKSFQAYLRSLKRPDNPAFETASF
ncbi:site-specific integrase [Chitinophaga oryzae]|uniref:Site-specific integrase n=1 Tax=Chitinophaga oryzae TaxID=2725414 RepID=A0ABX6LLJ5_9BACT|nr:site-specific integrase [Chitinophaga oryzae]QJB39713.1 site-specific integrase [Chitinophaga oryzae]